MHAEKGQQVTSDLYIRLYIIRLCMYIDESCNVTYVLYSWVYYALCYITQSFVF